MVISVISHVDDAKCKPDNSSQKNIDNIRQIHFPIVVSGLSAAFFFLFTPSQIDFAVSSLVIIAYTSFWYFNSDRTCD